MGVARARGIVQQLRAQLARSSPHHRTFHLDLTPCPDLSAPSRGLMRTFCPSTRRLRQRRGRRPGSIIRTGPPPLQVVIPIWVRSGLRWSRQGKPFPLWGWWELVVVRRGRCKMLCRLRGGEPSTPPPPLTRPPHWSHARPRMVTRPYTAHRCPKTHDPASPPNPGGGVWYHEWRWSGIEWVARTQATRVRGT